MNAELEKQLDGYIANIRLVGNSDPEVAHGLEDNLYETFIKSIAKDGPDNLKKIAKKILKTKKIDFPRWCA